MEGLVAAFCQANAAKMNTLEKPTIEEEIASIDSDIRKYRGYKAFERKTEDPAVTP